MSSLDSCSSLHSYLCRHPYWRVVTASRQEGDLSRWFGARTCSLWKVSIPGPCGGCSPSFCSHSPSVCQESWWIALSNASVVSQWQLETCEQISTLSDSCDSRLLRWQWLGEWPTSVKLLAVALTSVFVYSELPCRVSGSPSSLPFMCSQQEWGYFARKFEAGSCVASPSPPCTLQQGL